MYNILYRLFSESVKPRYKPPPEPYIQTEADHRSLEAAKLKRESKNKKRLKHAKLQGQKEG